MVDTMRRDKNGIYNLSKVLTVLIVSKDDYSVVDSVAHASSKTVALHYISEHLRDYASVVRKLEDEHLKRYASSIDFVSVEKELDEIKSADYRTFQTIRSLIVSQAISEASRIVLRIKRSKVLSILNCLKKLGVELTQQDVKSIMNEIKTRKEMIIAECGVREKDLNEIDEDSINRALRRMESQEESKEEDE